VTNAPKTLVFAENAVPHSRHRARASERGAPPAPGVPSAAKAPKGGDNMKLAVRALVIAGLAATFATPAHAAVPGPVCASTQAVVTMLKDYGTTPVPVEVVCVTMA
jgi:hypothetical protein